MQKQDSQKISVKVQGPQKKDGQRIYSVIGSDNNGDFNTVKRFSDFHQLRKILTAKWPGCYIPSLPQKIIIGNQDPIFLETRKRAMDSFMSILKENEIIWYSQEAQLFLHKIGETEKDLQKIKETTVIQILKKYNTCFVHLANRQVTDGVRDKLIKFGQQLKKLREPLQNLDKKVDQIFTSQKKYNEKFMSMIDSMLPEYEKNCLEVYKNGSEFQQVIFTGQKKEKIATHYKKLKNNTNSILQVVLGIKKQKLQIQSFQDLLRVKQQYFNQKQKVTNKIKDLQTQTTKIHGGKQSLISKIKNKSKEQQLKDNEDQIQKAQEEQKNLISLSNMISLLLAESQIQRFRKQRIASYYRLLKSYFGFEKNLCVVKKQLWTLILKQNSLEKEELDNFFESDKSPSKESLSQSPSKKIDLQDNNDVQQDQNKQTQDKGYMDEKDQKFNEVEIHEVQQISNEQENDKQQKEQQQIHQVTEND